MSKRIIQPSLQMNKWNHLWNGRQTNIDININPFLFFAGGHGGHGGGYGGGGHGGHGGHDEQIIKIVRVQGELQNWINCSLCDTDQSTNDKY